MKQFTNTFLLLSALAGLSVTTAQAATITWSVGSISTTDGDASDVSTQGNLVEAVNFIGSATTINGVTFEAFADTGNNHTTDNLTTEADTAYSNAGVYNAGNTSYDTLLDGFMLDNSADEIDYTLTGLTPGFEYEVQLFIADDRAGPDDRYLSVDGSGSTLGGNSTVYGGAAKPALVFAGTFTADASTQAFTAQVFSPANASVGTQLGAFQLRVIPAPDSTPPVITLLGDNPLNVMQGTSFADPGATALDNVDGDISGAITVTGDTVDTNTIGAYILSYGVSDAAGNAASTVTRTVNVSATPAATLKAGLDGVDFDAASSWGEGVTPSSSKVGTITVDAINLDRATANFGGGWTINHTAGDLQFDGGWNVNGGAGSAATTSYNLSGGSIVLTDVDGVSDEGNFLVNAITFNLSGDGAIEVGNAFSIGNSGSMNFLAGSGSLTAASYNLTVGTMNFVSGWTGSITIASLDAASWKTLLTTTLAGSTLNGVDIDDGIFDANFAVDNHTLTLVVPVNATSKGTPHSWLDFYSLVTSGDYEAADLLDSDSDGQLNWEEYQDGTDPTGVGVAAPIPFTLVPGAIGGAPDTLSFTPPNRKWHVEGSTDSVEWGVIPNVTLEVNADDGTVTASVPRLKGLGDDINAGMYRVVETQVNSTLTIFLTQGQSNMVGGGGSPWRNEPYLLSDHPLPNMLQMSRGLQRFFYDSGSSFELIPAFQPLQVTQDQGSGNQTESSFIALDFYFARAYAADHPAEDVLLIKNAKGGTGFVSDDWNDGDWLDANVTPYFQAAFTQNDLANRYTTIEFGGMLWHQGEADTATEASAAAYEANLTALVARHRSRVAAYITNDAPFILGTMNQHILAPNYDAKYPISAPVNAVHTNIANLVPNAGVVDLSDLDAKANVHFAHPEYRIIGARYYQKWLEVTTQRDNQKTWLDLYGLVTGGDYATADLLDSDSDGQFNWQEYRQGTNPVGHLPTESPVLELQVGNIGANDTLTFTPPDTAWVLKVSDTLEQWDDASEASFVTNADGSITVNAAHDTGLSKRFYRMVEIGW